MKQPYIRHESEAQQHGAQPQSQGKVAAPGLQNDGGRQHPGLPPDIPADELTQVFERFHRGRQVSSTNYGGLGLGLYISKQIIERHGGTIWVESAEGVGTTFYFSLPVTSVAEPQPKPAEQLVAR